MQDLIDKYGEGLELLLKVVRWGGVMVGGLCLLIYSREIGHFPEGIGFGEGLAFYFVCVGFAVTYAIYLAGVTSVGMIFLRWPMTWTNSWFYSRKGKRHESISTDFSEMWNPGVWGLSFAGVIVVLILTRSNLTALLTHASISLSQGFLVGLLLIARRHARLSQTGLVTTVSPPLAGADRIAERRRVPAVLASMIVLMPLLIMPGPGSLIDAAFRFAQLRKERATVHVLRPWPARLLEIGLVGQSSFLGEEYLRFDKVTVLLRSVGTRVVLEAPAADGKSQKVNLPADAVYIE